MRFRYLNRLASSSVFFTLISGSVLLTLAVAQYDETSLQYSVGDRARHTIYANETLRIQGEDTSKESLAKAQRSIPPIYGYQKGFVRAQSRTMVDNWGETRESFLNSLDKVFGKRTFRNIEISAPPFKEFISVFQARNDGFPIDDNIARRWARGDGADEVIGGLVGEFESFMTSYFIVSDQALLSAPSELPNVDLISLSGSAPQNLVSLPNPTFVKLASQQLISESEARKRFSELNSMYRSEAQKYVLQFVRPNTIYLEQLSLERWYGSSGSTKHETIFQKGEEIVVQGETITPVIKEALDLMIINLRFSRLRSSVQIELAKENKEGFEESPKTNSDQLAEPESKRESTPTLDSTAPLPKEDKKEGMLPPLLSPTTVAQTESLKENQSAAMLNSPAENALSADTGRDYRATSSTPSLVGSFYIWVIGIVLVAVVSALVILHFRSGPPDYLAENSPVLLQEDRQSFIKSLSSQLTQTLFRQRQELIKSKESATAQVAAMENRLARMQPEIFDKLRAYEEKIRDLEAQLKQRGVDIAALKAHKVSSSNNAKEEPASTGTTPVPFPGNRSEIVDEEGPIDLMHEVLDDLDNEDVFEKRTAKGFDA